MARFVYGQLDQAVFPARLFLFHNQGVFSMLLALFVASAPALDLIVFDDGQTYFLSDQSIVLPTDDVRIEGVPPTGSPWTNVTMRSQFVVRDVTVRSAGTFAWSSSRGSMATWCCAPARDS